MIIKIPIYGGKIKFYTDHATYARAVKRDTGESVDDPVLGVTHRCDSGDYIVGVFDGSLQTAVHEAGHVTFAIMEHKGIDPTEPAGEEAYCYLLDHIWAAMQKEMVKHG